jgi:hypothetical protein
MEKKYTSTEIKICGECLGEGGEYKGTGLYDHHHGTFDSSDWVPCRLCKGAGMVRVQKDTVVIVTPHTPFLCRT